MAQYRRNLTRNDVLQQIFEDNDSADEDLDDGGEVGAPEFDDDDEFVPDSEDEFDDPSLPEKK